MKSIEFKQVDNTQRKLLLTVYFVLAVSFIIYAFTSDPIIFFINSFQRGVFPGILAGCNLRCSVSADTQLHITQNRDNF